MMSAVWWGVRAILAVFVIAGTAAAHERLGTVQFPVSCAPGVQVEFDRAVAVLHSFWFDAAIRAFSAVGQADPGCGMAFWGIAMTLSHAPPEPALLAHAWAAVERAKAAGTEALRAFEAMLRSEPKRFRSLHGATRTAELAGDLATTRIHATMLVALTERADTERPELAHVRGLLRKANIDAGGSP